MTRRRWIADEVQANRAIILGTHANHLSRVLRARVGQIFDIAAGDTLRHGRIVSIQDDRVEFELGDEISAVEVPEVSLLLAIFKFDRMEWAIEKATELGVARMIPLESQRSDRHLIAAASKRVERWRRIAQQASEQSRRASMPEIADPIKTSDAVKLQASTRILLNENRPGTLLKDALNHHDPNGNLLMAVGPEGGWTTEEEEVFRQAGWTSASLGSTILRAETAAIAALAIAIAELS
jgi:16S rRNA (uracil1498-N3)-methyltransferase